MCSLSCHLVWGTCSLDMGRTGFVGVASSRLPMRGPEGIASSFFCPPCSSWASHGHLLLSRPIFSISFYHTSWADLQPREPPPNSLVDSWALASTSPGSCGQRRPRTAPHPPALIPSAWWVKAPQLLSWPRKCYQPAWLQGSASRALYKHRGPFPKMAKLVLIREIWEPDRIWLPGQSQQVASTRSSREQTAPPCRTPGAGGESGQPKPATLAQYPGCHPVA